MKRTIAATLVAAALSAVPFHANAAERSAQPAGAGIGVVLGAIAGGPLGALVGASLGAGVGYDMDRSATVEALNGALARERAAAVRLRARTGELEAELAAARGSAAADNNLLLALSAGVEQQLHFRNGSDRLEPFELERLTALAVLLEAAPQLAVSLTGHADPRGGDAANQALSARRVAVVEGALERAGIDPKRVSTRAVGEGQPLSAPGDQGAYPFDRRVTLRLEVR
ncbi:OmpA family protein [Endothiovibrio diazotrophicus]